jgi:MFS transporter, SP family, sugar:H+ symporter
MATLTFPGELGQLRQTEHATARTIFFSFVAAIGGFLFGFDTAVINGAVDAIRAEYRMSAAGIGLVVSCALIGSALGAWYAGRLADRIGRVRAMLIAATLFALSALGSGLAFGPASLVFWRFIGGAAIGMASVIAPAYIAEVAPARMRGRLGALQQLAIVIGIFMALLSDAFLAGTAGGAGRALWLELKAWRWMFLAGVVPALAYGLLALQIPESPRFLVRRGELAKAADVLRQVLGIADVDDKIAAINESLAATRARPNTTSLRALAGPRLGLLPVVWIGILLSIFQQFVGINVIFYYSTTLWRSVGFSEANALTVTVITSVTNVLVTLVAISLVDKVGRRPLLLVGSAGMALSLFSLVYCFAHALAPASAAGSGVTLPSPYGGIALVAANVFVISFGVSWGPVVWVLLAEIFANRIRAPGLALAAAAQWIANFLVSTTFPIFVDGFGLATTYLFYAASAAMSFLFVWRKVPETKGTELESVQA